LLRGRETLRSFHWIDLFDDFYGGIKKLLSTIDPSSKHISKLVTKLANPSPQKRIDAASELGRLGPLAANAIPNLLQRIHVEAELKYGLLPLAAIENALVKIEHEAPHVYEEIDRRFEARGVDRNGHRISNGDHLDGVEQLILAAVLILGQSANDTTIYEQMEKLAAGLRPVSLGAVYTTLDRLEKKGSATMVNMKVRSRGQYPCGQHWSLTPGVRPMTSVGC
jgi:hypothetical protein